MCPGLVHDGELNDMTDLRRRVCSLGNYSVLSLSLSIVDILLITIIQFHFVVVYFNFKLCSQHKHCKLLGFIENVKLLYTKKSVKLLHEDLINQSLFSNKIPSRQTCHLSGLEVPAQWAK